MSCILLYKGETLHNIIIGNGNLLNLTWIISCQTWRETFLNNQSEYGGSYLLTRYSKPQQLNSKRRPKITTTLNSELNSLYLSVHFSYLVSFVQGRGGAWGDLSWQKARVHSGPGISMLSHSTAVWGYQSTQHTSFWTLGRKKKKKTLNRSYSWIQFHWMVNIFESCFHCQ